jgi:hypothetical protein
MAQASISLNAEGGSREPPTSTGNTSITDFYMLKGDVHIATRSQDYEMSESFEKGKEATNPPVTL